MNFSNLIRLGIKPSSQLGPVRDDDDLENLWNQLSPEQQEQYRRLATEMSPAELRQHMVETTKGPDTQQLPTPRFEDIPSIMEWNRIEEVSSLRLMNLFRPFRQPSVHESDH